MKIFDNCPFCNELLTKQSTRGDGKILKNSFKYFCQNEVCKIVGSVRFKMFTENDHITHLHFLLENYMVDISYLNNTTGIGKYKKEFVSEHSLDSNEYKQIFYLSRDGESEIVINESPEISFKDMDKLLKKIKTWTTFS